MSILEEYPDLKLYRVTYQYGWEQGGYVGQSVSYGIGTTQKKAEKEFKGRIKLQYENDDEMLMYFDEYLSIVNIEFVKPIDESLAGRLEEYIAQFGDDLIK